MPDSSAGNPLMNILLGSGRVTEEQFHAFEAEAAAAGKPVEVLLMEKKVVDDEIMAKARAAELGLSYADLQGKDINVQTLNLIPKSVAETNKAVSFDRDEVHVSIGLVDPRDARAMQAMDFLSQNIGINPKYFVISNASFTNALKKYATIGKDVAGALEIAKEKFVPEKKTDAAEERIEEVIKGAPVSRIVSVILRHAVDGGASDIHIEPYGEETRVRYRVDGVLRTTLTLPKYIHASLVARVKVLSNLKLDETRVPQDGRITESFNGKVIDFRVSTIPLADTEKVVMRILDTTRGVPTLDQLGFRSQFVDLIKREVRKPHGIFLITGPTGSGKSTTLLTVLTMRNEEGVNISTLEDPIEYYIKGVNQSQVRPDVGYDFAAGLRAILRQDPNIVMVGEIRDGETAELAIHAALTGHLIFSTLHTNDAIGVVPRMVDMHVEPFLLSATLNVAIAQRLGRKICERCKSPTSLPPEIEDSIRREIDAIPETYKTHLDLSPAKLVVYKGVGCVRCGNSGYVGRVACAEMIVYDEELRLLITKGFPMDDVRKILNKQGVITLRQDALLKALEGSTTIEEVMRITAE